MLTNSPSPSLRCRRDILAAREVFTIAQQEVPNWIGFRRLTLSENDIRVLKRLFAATDPFCTKDSERQ